MSGIAAFCRSPGAALMGLALAGAVLRVAGATRAQIAAAVADPQAYVTATGADQFVLVLATAIGWVLLGWIALGGLLVLGSAAPGLVGWLFHQLARLLLPATLRRFVSLALGVTLLTGTSVASAAPPATSAAISVSLNWPGPDAMTISPSPDWPPGPFGEPGDAEQNGPHSPAAGDEPAASGQPNPAGPAAYSVQPGECLWDIAERALAQAGSSIDAASVATAVARWWQLNRSQIDDPDLIFAGQVLTAPTPLP